MAAPARPNMVRLKLRLKKCFMEVFLIPKDVLNMTAMVPRQP